MVPLQHRIKIKTLKGVPMKKVRLKDLAQMAGVSETTVSLVLNGRPSRISQAKRDEIEALAELHHYRANHLARSLSTQTTHTIGLIVPDIENPFFATVAKVITNTLSKEGYMVLIANSDESLEADKRLIKELLDRQVDGLILCVSNESNASQAFYEKVIQKIDVPYVLLDRGYQNVDENQVLFDSYYGSYIATQYLIEKGHTGIACITGKLDTFVGKRRLEGYTAAMADANLHVDEAMIFEGDFRYKSAQVHVPQIIANEMITAVFASNDIMAYALVSELLKQQDRDVEVVGYDNLELSNMFGYVIASVAQDVEALGSHAVSILFEGIKNKKKLPNVVLKPYLHKV